MTAPLRASDQDRHEAVLALSEAFADGRLDSEEFEARQSQALVATYVHDLDPLFADLPTRVSPASRPAPPVMAPRRRGPRGGRAPIAAAAVALVVALAFVTGAHALWLLVPVLWFASAARRRRHWYAVHHGYSAQLPSSAPPR